MGPDQTGTAAPKPAKPREWSPRIWIGCDLFAWLRLMTKGRFAWHLPHLHIGACTFAVSCWHTILKYVQEGLYGRRIRDTPIEHAPVFIIGHWRTGTTLLHELLILDPRHNCPNTYECFEPNHFLLTEGLVRRYLGFLMPDHRPMDKMPAGWDRPQEDEFALCMMGQPSPYLHIAFPNQEPIDESALDLDSLPAWQRRAWKQAFVHYLQTLTFKDPRRLILKSPPHSCRIPTLLELFPDARFIHIVRNPYVVFPSTVNLWRSLYAKHGMQRPTYAGLEEYVLRTFVRLYEKLEEGRNHVRPERFHEMSYEDLVRNPIGEMERAYQRLELGPFDLIRPRLEEYVARNKGYETSNYQLAPDDRDRVTARWGAWIRRYGYAVEPTQETTLATVPAGSGAERLRVEADMLDVPALPGVSHFQHPVR
jgi:omega-hydroxy-beta-dihydromenaquinone-9 sulfotransferase